MKKGVLLCLAILIASSAWPAIYNVEKISELSESNSIEYSPNIRNNELSFYFVRAPEAIDPGNEDYFQTTRSSTSASFDEPTSAPFVNILTSDQDGTFWISEDGLRIYFQRSPQSGTGTSDFYKSTRSSVSAPFPAATKMTSLSEDDVNEITPVLTDDELAIYYNTDTGDPGSYNYRVYRAERASVSSDFGTPSLVSEIPENYVMLDVSNDELTMIMTNFAIDPNSIFYTQRSTTSESFPSPEELEDMGSSMIGAAEMTDDLSRIYFNMNENPSGNLGAWDLYAGDLVIGPTATPTPTPTPIWPEPTPPVDVAATRDQIASHTGQTANPWGAAFDSQGRFIFFDQKVYNYYDDETLGSNNLIRMTSGVSGPSFETIATESQLAAVIPDFPGTSPYFKNLVTLDALSDDSVVMVVSGTSPHALIRIVPGTTPQITTIAEFQTTLNPPGCWDMAVDRTQTPNLIYLYYTNTSNYSLELYVVSADQTNATPTFFADPQYHNFPPMALTIDANGDVIYAGDADFQQIYRIDKDTKAETALLPELMLNSFTEERFDYVTSLDIDPVTGDILGTYYTGWSYPYTYSRYNLFAARKNSDGSYSAASELMLEQQVYADEDVLPWYISGRNLVPSGGGLAIARSGGYMYLSNASPTFNYTSFTARGIECILKIGTEFMLGAHPESWTNYE